MNQKWMQCPLCGHQFDPSAHAACLHCPLDKHCPLVCCPACGYTTVNLRSSTVGRLMDSLFSRWKRRHYQHQATLQPGFSISGIPPGHRVQVVGLGPLPPARRVQLQAYGLVPGRSVRVLQQSPVTVVLADHTELALEQDLADAILVSVQPE